jgi:hypothetical protein
VSHKKDILPVNDECEWHGYCEEYHYNGKLEWRGVLLNGKDYGYHVVFDKYGKKEEGATGYFLKDVRVDNRNGYCLIWCKNCLTYRDILPTNENGEYNGYCEEYYRNGRLYQKGVCLDGLFHGYCQTFEKNGLERDDETGYFLRGNWMSNNNEEGWCYIDNVVMKV